MASAITMRELQKISASSISSLPHTVPIRNGQKTVGFLVPLRKAPVDLVERAVRLIEEERAARTPEDEAGITDALREIGAE